MATGKFIMRANLIVLILWSSVGRSEGNASYNDQEIFDRSQSASQQAQQRNKQDGALNEHTNDIDQQNASFGSGLANGIFQQQTQGVQDPQNNEARNRANSREDLLADMNGQASTGAGIAAGLGAAMIAIGTPMSLDILNPPRMVAGIELIIKGGIELAQAAVRDTSASKYSEQRDMLNSAGALTAPTASAGSKIPIDNEQLNKLLQGSGITPDEFKDRLAKGEFASATDVLKALGKDVSPEALKEGKSLADAKLGEIFAKAKAETEAKNPQIITANLDKKKEDSQGEQVRFASGANGTSNDKKDSGPQAADSSSKTGDSSPLHASSDSSLKNFNAAGEKGSDDVASLYQKLFGAGAKENLESERNQFRNELAALGISLPIKGVSIFALAHRQYNEFGKYRKSYKPVQTKVARR